MNATLSNLYRLAFRIGVGGQLHVAGAGAYLLGSTWLYWLTLVLLSAPLFFFCCCHASRRQARRPGPLLCQGRISSSLSLGARAEY